MTVKVLKKKNNMQGKAKGPAFKMKAGKEGPMKKNFSSAFKDNGDKVPKNYFLREVKSAKGEAETKALKGKARIDAFSKRHGVEYKMGVNTAGTVEQGRGQKMFVDPKGRSIEMNERRFLDKL